MSFPNIIFKHTNVTTKESPQYIVEQKFASLERYIGDETDTTCEVEFERIPSHNSGEICRIEVNLWLAGKLHRAEATQETFEKAVDVVKDELDRELNKENEKQQTLYIKGRRAIKEILRFGRK